jgi:hypothetical protein
MAKRLYFVQHDLNIFSSRIAIKNTFPVLWLFARFLSFSIFITNKFAASPVHRDIGNELKIWL